MAMFSAALNGLLNRASVLLPGPMALHAELEHDIVVMYACICYICLLRYGRIRLDTVSASCCTCLGQHICNLLKLVCVAHLSS